MHQIIHFSSLGLGADTLLLTSCTYCNHTFSSSPWALCETCRVELVTMNWTHSDSSPGVGQMWGFLHEVHDSLQREFNNTFWFIWDFNRAWTAFNIRAQCVCHDTCNKCTVALKTHISHLTFHSIAHEGEYYLSLFCIMKLKFWSPYVAFTIFILWSYFVFSL